MGAEINLMIEDYRRKLKKALARLSVSYQKVLLLPVDIAKMSENELEIWESFTARFARASDLYLSKYLRSLVLKDDPAFRGGFRDFLDQAEKLDFIADVESWMEIRELRNMTAHDYTEEDLSKNFKKLLKYAPLILAIEKTI